MKVTNCKDCIYRYPQTKLCSIHHTNVLDEQTCSVGLPQDNRTNEEVLQSITDNEAKLKQEIESKVHRRKEEEWTPAFDKERTEGGKALLNSTFGQSTGEMLDELIAEKKATEWVLGMYQISKQGELDPVNHPSHYTDGKIEVIDYIEDKAFNYHLGNAIKYISRAGKKDDAVTDLKKAVWYINRYIELIKE